MDQRHTYDPQAKRLKSNSSCKSDDSRLALAHFNRGGVVSQCLLLSALVFALASCGERDKNSITITPGGPETTNSSKNGGGLGGYLGTGCSDAGEMLSSPTGICLPPHNTSGSTGSSPTPAPTPPPTTLASSIARYTEFEVNDSPVNATPVAFPPRPGDNVLGIGISGSVGSGNDSSDYFVLTPVLSKTYLVYLCKTTCMEHPTDSKVAIRVFDESLNLVTGNPLDGESTKFLTADLVAGLTYYVQIVDIDMGSIEYPYRLVIIE